MISESARGTVVDHPHFDKEADANGLRAAMKGAGTNEQALIDILATKSSKQRQELKLFYKTWFGRDLEDDIRSETSNNFCSVLKGLLMTPVQYDAYCLNKAMKGLGTREHTLTEIFGSRTNEEIAAITEEYNKTYEGPLESKLKSETSSDYAKLLISLSTGNRQSDYDPVDHQKVVKDVETLYLAGEKKVGTDESKFIQVLGARSRPHLQAVFDLYLKKYNKDLFKVIKSETSGDFKSLMITIGKCAHNASDYFAEALYKSMKGAGTTDTDLIRIIIARSEIDLADIKEIFIEKYKKSLADWIIGDTSGDYKKTLLKLIGE